MDTKIFKCQLCRNFQSITARRLLNHIYSVHSKEANFRINCPFSLCNAPSYTKYNSFYKHILKNHQNAYSNAGFIGHLSGEHQHNDVADHTAVIVNELNVQGEDLNYEYEPSSDNDSVFSCHQECIIRDDINVGSDFNMTDHAQLDINVKKSVACYLLSIKERHNLSQTTMDSIINKTKFLLSDILSLAQSTIERKMYPCSPESLHTVSTAFKDIECPFNGLDTEPLLKSYIEKNFDLVDFREIVLGTKLIYLKKGSDRQIHEKEESFIYVPILESIKQLLSNKKLRAEILQKHSTSSDGVFYDFYDGSLFRDDQYFVDKENVIGLILYHDEVEICNPLGSKSSKHKLDMYYYTVSNLDPRYRSKHSAIRLLAIVNAKFVTKYGIMKILAPIVEDLKKLYNGVCIDFINESFTIFGKVVSCTGDTLGQHAWGGFKEGVGGAFQKCRSCYCTFENMQKKFSESSFVQRSKESYDQNCTDIENSSNNVELARRRKKYGINTRSILTEIPDFDVTKQLPQDVMHTILEGVLQYELRLVLHYYLKKGVFSLSELNNAIENHNYGYSEVSDKPGPLKDTVFSGSENYKLKLNAAQARLFLRLIPFILMQIYDCEDIYYEFILQLHKITQICFTPVISVEMLQHLSLLIEIHLKRFKELFPSKNITPKQHYLVHFPTMIRTLGPLIRYSCFSFESAHKYFKKVAQRQNFKNITLSLAKRYQRLECINFHDGSFDSNSHPIFGTERKCGVIKTLKKEQITFLRESFDEFGLLPDVSLSRMYSVSWITIHGTKFKKNCFIMIGATSSPSLLPLFGEVTRILIIGDFIYFEVNLYRTNYLDDDFQAYNVEKLHTDETAYVPYEKITDYNVFHLKDMKEHGLYLMPKYDVTALLQEHLQGRNPMKINGCNI